MINAYYFLLLFPAFSITQLLIGIHSQNRILWFPIGLILIFFMKITTFKKFYLAIVGLNLYFILYYFIASIHSWNILMYFAYIVTFLLLAITSLLIEKEKEKFVKFFKIFFICNLIYSVFQIIALNIGMDSLSMIHSNLPAQANYSIPVFVTEPFYRFTGLFNESSPFAFYLSIAFCFFLSLKEKFLNYKRMAAFFLILCGSKFAYAFLILHIFFFSKYKIVKFIMAGVIGYVLYYIVNDIQYLLDLTEGQIASLIERSAGLDIDYNQLGIWGNGLGKSSEGELALNMYAILLNGFGYSSIFIFIFIILFYVLINNEKKKYFILPFLMATFSNGSLLIFQYTLLAYCLVYLNEDKSVDSAIDKLDVK